MRLTPILLWRTAACINLLILTLFPSTPFLLSLTMPKGLQTPFRSVHDVPHGIEETEHFSAGRVLSILDHFFLKFYREANPGVKRKRRTNVNLFTHLFRTEVTRSAIPGPDRTAEPNSSLLIGRDKNFFRRSSQPCQYIIDTLRE